MNELTINSPYRPLFRTAQQHPTVTAPEQTAKDAGADALAAVAGAHVRDLTSYVGEDVTAAVWHILTQRAMEYGWTYTARPIMGGVHITGLEGRRYADDTTA